MPPILISLTLAYALFGAAVLFSNIKNVVAYLDPFVIVAAGAVVVRFGRQAWRSAIKPRPFDYDYWIAGGVAVALSVVLIRVLRLVGIELGIIHSEEVAYAFGIITLLMCFGFALKASSPLIGGHQLSPIGVIIVAAITGSLLALVLARMTDIL